MRTEWKRLAGIALAALVIVAVSAPEGFGIWRTLLNEYFDKDQDVPELRWPWGTPPRNPNLRWHWNPYPPHPLAEPVRTEFCWGVQGYMYNSYIRQREEFPQSIWCAFTNRADVLHPRSPEDGEYMDDDQDPPQNAWAWWGPFDLRTAVNAAVSFWIYVDVRFDCYDSLSVVVSNTARNMTLNGLAFDTTLAFGVCRDDTGAITLTTFNHDLRDWKRREFYLDSLRLLDRNRQIRDTISYIGERYCYLAFVWQTNNRVIDGRGAFVDDVMVMLDDGLFELLPLIMEYGFPVNEEVIDWTTDTPGNNDNIYFRLQWRALGNGEVGPFTIALKLDDQVIYSEERTVVAGVDSTYITTADTLWDVVSGPHTVRWEIDAPIEDGGRIEESDENNNVASHTFDVVWNPPPQFMILNPEQDSTVVPVDVPYRIFYSVTDSNETDLTFTVYMYWTEDTTGLAANPDLMYEYHYIRHNFAAPAGNGSFVWNLLADYDAAAIDTGQVVFIVGFAADGFPGNYSISMAPGRVLTQPPLSVVIPARSLPAGFGLTRAYPNPFNSSLTIEYGLPAAGAVDLSVFDLAGRRLQTLQSGAAAAGQHLLNWSPQGIGAGVYLIRLEAAGKVSMQKAIYTP